jgi:hypothetical protein
MGILFSTLRNCCLGRDEEKEEIKEKEIKEKEETKEENHYNLDYSDKGTLSHAGYDVPSYLDNLEYGTTIRYYILNNVTAY